MPRLMTRVLCLVLFPNAEESRERDRLCFVGGKIEGGLSWARDLMVRRSDEVGDKDAVSCAGKARALGPPCLDFTGLLVSGGVNSFGPQIHVFFKHPRGIWADHSLHTGTTGSGRLKNTRRAWFLFFIVFCTFTNAKSRRCKGHFSGLHFRGGLSNLPILKDFFCMSFTLHRCMFLTDDAVHVAAVYTLPGIFLKSSFS